MRATIVRRRFADERRSRVTALYVLFPWQLCPQRLPFFCEPVLLPTALRLAGNCHLHKATLERWSKVAFPEVIFMPKTQCVLDLHAPHPSIKHQH